MLYAALQQLLADYLTAAEKSQIALINVTEPKHEQFGHLTTNLAMVLAKYRRQAPAIIAADIQAYCTAKAPDAFAAITIHRPGFINFTCQHNFLYQDLATIHANPTRFGTATQRHPLKYNLELVSANPTGLLHIGHVRNGVVGDVFARILRSQGYQVVSEYYTNDAGKQINYLGLTLFHHYLRACGQTTTLSANCYQGDCYAAPAQKIKAQIGAKWINVAYDEETIRDPQVNAWFRHFGVNYFLKLIQATLTELDIQIDYYISEQSMYDQGKITNLLATYQKKGYLYKKDGAWWFNSTAFGDDKDRVLQKSDGTYSYIVADLAAHAEKLARTKADLLINFWGGDHHGYIGRMNAGLQMLGFAPNILEIILIQMVRLVKDKVEVKISKRKGTAIWANDLLKLMSVGELRYWMCARNPGSHLEIDLNLLQQRSMSNAYFYNQYAVARINQIFKLAEQQQLKATQVHDLLTTEEENRLMLKMSQYPKILATVIAKRSPDLLCDYFFTLSKLFHSYYNQHRIINLQNHELSQQRLGFLKALLTIYRNGFSLLGVSLLEKM